MSATPYAWSVLKAISRHFRRIRSIVSSQIQHISRVLGEELLSLPSCSRGGKAVAREHGPVWRPQRGLPERAVSVLRAWLFDHFLHPSSEMMPADTPAVLHCGMVRSTGDGPV